MTLAAEKLLRKYEKLKEINFPITETFDFGKELGESKEIALHFELILEDEKNPRPQRWYPDDFFHLHRQDGIDYLYQLLTSEDKDYAVCAAYLLAHLLTRGRYQNQAELMNGLIKALVLLAESEAPEHRRKCLIALGWVGTEREIPTLANHLQNDTDSLCRAWSASSFMQMSGRVNNDILKNESVGALISCFENETDVFVRGVAAETVQDIWNVKFGLRSSAVESRNQKAVDKAVGRALEYLTAAAKETSADSGCQ